MVREGLEKGWRVGLGFKKGWMDMDGFLIYYLIFEYKEREGLMKNSNKLIGYKFITLLAILFNS